MSYFGIILANDVISGYKMYVITDVVIHVVIVNKGIQYKIEAIGNKVGLNLFNE